jgi:hypothetical protein
MCHKHLLLAHGKGLVSALELRPLPGARGMPFGTAGQQACLRDADRAPDELTPSFSITYQEMPYADTRKAGCQHREWIELTACAT